MAVRMVKVRCMAMGMAQGLMGMFMAVLPHDGGHMDMIMVAIRVVVAVLMGQGNMDVFMNMPF